MKKFQLAVLWLGIVVTLSFPAQSQPSDIAPQWEVRAGGGLLLAPSFPGSKDYQLLLLPNVEIAYGDIIEASVQRGLRYNLPLRSNFTVGPIAKLDFGREQDGSRTFRIAGKSSTALRGMGDVAATIEFGGFVDFSRGPITASVELRHGVNGHKGLIGEAKINYTRRSSVEGIGTIFSFGPSVTFSDTGYTQAFFGVTAEQSAGSDLRVFDAGGGINSYGVGSTAVFSFNQRFAATLLARFDRLVGDAAISPLVKERGAANQALVGLFLSYRLFQ